MENATKERRLPKGISKRADGRYQGRFTFQGERFTLYDRDIKALQKKMADAIGKYGPAQGGSYLNTINPFSTMLGGVDRIPAWWMSGFSDTPEGRRTGMLTFKMGATALTAAAAVAAWRAWKHRGKLQDIENDSAAAELGQQLNTTFEPEMAKGASMKKEATQDKKAVAWAALLPWLIAGGTAAGTFALPYINNWQNNRMKPGEVPAAGVYSPLRIESVLQS
jgi:hypothetical protein